MKPAAKSRLTPKAPDGPPPQYPQVVTFDSSERIDGPSEVYGGPAVHQRRRFELLLTQVRNRLNRSVSWPADLPQRFAAVMENHPRQLIALMNTPEYETLAKGIQKAIKDYQAETKQKKT